MEGREKARRRDNVVVVWNELTDFSSSVWLLFIVVLLFVVVVVQTPN